MGRGLLDKETLGCAALAVLEIYRKSIAMQTLELTIHIRIGQLQITGTTSQGGNRLEGMPSGNPPQTAARNSQGIHLC